MPGSIRVAARALADIIGARRVRTVAMIPRGDSLQVDRGRAEVGVPELALSDVEPDALAASSSACPWRSWCGANRRLSPA